MISPRNAFITLLKSKQNKSTQKARQVYMPNKTNMKSINISINKSKDHLSIKQYSTQRLRKSYNRGYSSNNDTNYRPSKMQGNKGHHKQKKQVKTDVFSQTLPSSKQNKQNFESQLKKNKEGENCRVLLKLDAQPQKNYFIKVKQLSDIKKHIDKNHPNIKNLTTIPRQISLQFLLTQPNIPGQFLNGQTLYFKGQLITNQYHHNNYNNLITLQHFYFIKQLGSGGFSKVYLCQSKIDGFFYAVKLIQKQMVIKNQKKGIIMNQRNIMTKSKHPFIIQLKYAFQSQKYIVFVLEYCPGGQLFGLIKKYGRLTQDVAKFYIIQVLLGISYLHSQKVIYRDIKPQNILLGIDGHVKIADLGLAKPEMNDGILAYSFCGSPQYMSPQMIMQVGHTYPVDFYCLGALLYELLTGLPPFYSHDANEIYESVLQEQLTFPEDILLSNQSKNLLKSLLHKDPKQRLGSLYGSKQILVHPWFGKQKIQNYVNKKIKPPMVFNKLQQINMEEIDKDNYKDNLKKIVKEQKGEGKQFKCIMDNFYYNGDGKVEDGNQTNKLQLRQNAKTQRKLSATKQKMASNRSMSRESKQNKQPIRKMKKKHSVGLGLQASLNNFFRK